MDLQYGGDDLCLDRFDFRELCIPYLTYTIRSCKVKYFLLFVPLDRT